jgi:hypothetical protein
MFTDEMLDGPFIVGQTYTCVYNDQRSFTVGKEYRCVEFTGSYNSKLMKDNSNVKFIDDRGNLNTMFGSIAVGCFSKDPNFIKEKFTSSKVLWHEQTLNSYQSFKAKLETALRELKSLNENQERYNKYLKLLGEEVNKVAHYEDNHTLINMIKKYDERYVPQDPLLRYLDSQIGLKHLRKYKLEETGTWQFYLNGVNKFREGTFHCILKFIVEVQPDFSGEIEKIKIETC